MIASVVHGCNAYLQGIMEIRHELHRFFAVSGTNNKNPLRFAETNVHRNMH